MNKRIQEILRDLYVLDASFRDHENEIVKIVERLLKSNSEIRIDQRFVQKLRAQLSWQTDKANQSVASETFPKKIAYFLAGALLTFFVFLLSFSIYLSSKSEITQEPEEQRFALTSEIKKVKSNAFGSLLENQAESTQNRAAENVGLGGGGPILPESAQSLPLIAPFPRPLPISNFRFVYKGESFNVADDKSSVYKRIGDQLFDEKLSNIIEGFNFDLVDLAQLENAKVSFLRLAEDRAFGYEVTLSSVEDMAHINQNWSKWPNPFEACRDQACFLKLRLKTSDIPSEKELISIASSFLDKYKIRTMSDEDPVIFDNIQFQELANEESSVFVSDNINVIYPLKINDILTYDTVGNLDGLVVSVNIRYKKVSAVRNIYVQNYESSDYEIETDANKIIEFVENSGARDENQDIESIEIELGSPSFGLVKTWKYAQEKRISEEFFVPSYIFPITNIPEGNNYHRKNIIVPIVKEMMQDRQVITPGIPEILLPSAEETEMK